MAPKLKMLILCMILPLSCFSQTDTIKKIVLSRDIAKLVIKDLIKGDSCEKELKLREEQVCVLENIIKEKDSIINKFKEIKPIKEKPKLGFYSGIMLGRIDINNATLFSNINIEYKKYSGGIYYKYDVNSSTNYGLILTYKIF